MKHEFKIRFNTEHAKNPGLCWRVLVDDVEYLVADVRIDGVPVRTAEHILPTGEKKWSIFCTADYHATLDNVMYIRRSAGTSS